MTLYCCARHCTFRITAVNKNDGYSDCPDVLECMGLFAIGAGKPVVSRPEKFNVSMLLMRWVRYALGIFTGYFIISSQKSCGGFMAPTGAFGCPPLFSCKAATECCDLPGKCVFLKGTLLLDGVNGFLLK